MNPRHRIRLNKFNGKVMLLVLTATVFGLSLFFGATVVHAQTTQINHKLPLLQVNVTHQSTHVRLPWQKLTPSYSSGIGAILEGQRVLVTAGLVQDATYIELEQPTTGERAKAEIEVIDFEANLALLHIKNTVMNDTVFANTQAIELQNAKNIQLEDELQALQMGRVGERMANALQLDKAVVGRYALPSSVFLTFEANGIIRTDAPSVTLPVVHQNKLAGMLLSYDNNNQRARLIPIEVIARFLNNYKTKAHFPSIGLQGFPTLDVQFRKHLGLSSQQGGIYIGYVKPDASAAHIGIRVGDILLNVNGNPIDRRGDYNDVHWGPLHYSHIWRTQSSVGDVATATVLRAGKTLQLQGVLKYTPLENAVIPVLLPKGKVDYIVHGGLIVQELNFPYLHTFGEDWELAAPPHLVHLALANQNQKENESENTHESKQGKESNKPSKRIVLLGGVLPVTGTQGYQGIGSVVIERINGISINDLTAAAKALQPGETHNGVHKIELSSYPYVLYLDEAQAQIDDVELQNGVYKIKKLVNLSSNTINPNPNPTVNDATIEEL